MSTPRDAGSSRRILSTSVRRRQRACDACRHKKIKCDGMQLEGYRCTPCRTQDLACAYGENLRSFYPVNQSVLELQQKLERMESLLSKLAPGTDIGALEQETRTTGFSESPFSSTSTPQAEDFQPADDDDEGAGSSEDEIFTEPDVEEIVCGVRNMSVASHTRFYGKSSGLYGVRRAMQIDPELVWHGSVPQPYAPPHLRHIKRPEIWMTHPWERDSNTPTRWRRHGEYVFPEDDVVPALFELYFAHVNPHQPVLHRPTFTSDVAAGLHRCDKTFGAIVLLVCALGARFSDDTRVLLDGYRSWYSAGHKWFRQVEGLQNTSLTQPITLHEMQMTCLLLAHCQWTGHPQASWNIVGLTIRRAQDIGVHRKSFFRGRVSPVDEELWKRAIWVVLSQDRHMGIALGRPLALYDDDFDLDLPTECDEEYWIADDPAQNFKQPAGKVSDVAAFNLITKLQRIAALALRTIYAVDKSSNNVVFRMMGPDWEQRMVAELDSMLNKWVDSIPVELRPDVGNQDEKPLVLFDQTTTLWMLYYHAQILIHRPFLDARRHATLAQPSFVICTGAARAGSQLIGRHYKRSSMILPFIPLPLLTCGIALVLNIRNRHLRKGSLAEAMRDLEYVDLNLQALAQSEARWQVAGRLCDLLQGLRSVVVSGDEELRTATQSGDTVNSQTMPIHELPSHLRMAKSRHHKRTHPLASLPGCLPASNIEEQTLPHHQQSIPSFLGDTQQSPYTALDDGFPAYGGLRGLADASPFFGQPPAPPGDTYQQQPYPQQAVWNDLAAQMDAPDIPWSAMEGIESNGPTLMGDTTNIWGVGAASLTDTSDWDAYIMSIMSGQYDPRFAQGPQQQQQVQQQPSQRSVQDHTLYQ